MENIQKISWGRMEAMHAPDYPWMVICYNFNLSSCINTTLWSSIKISETRNWEPWIFEKALIWSFIIIESGSGLFLQNCAGIDPDGWRYIVNATTCYGLKRYRLHQCHSLWKIYFRYNPSRKKDLYNLATEFFCSWAHIYSE